MSHVHFQWLASGEQTIPNYSAILDLPCETNIARQGPHSDICKFAATDNEAFRQIREKIYNSSGMELLLISFARHLCCTVY
jgi:hypothetical protein